MKQKYNNSGKYKFDLIVIGSGAAGSVAAFTAAASGKRVCLIEQHKFGGETIHHGTIPTKKLMETAKRLTQLKTAHRYGIRVSAVSYNYRLVQNLKEQAVEQTGVYDQFKSYKSDNITSLRGHAHFIDANTVSVGLKHLSANKFLIATGATPIIPNIPGLDSVDFVTYQQIYSLPRPPKSLFIIGGGAVAYETAQIFASLGCKVHIAETRDHLLPFEDPEVGDSAEAALQSLGVKVFTSAKIINISNKMARKIIIFEQGGQHFQANVEMVMIACGKKPYADFGLDNASIGHAANGIAVNRFLQTTVKHIFAAGEVTGAVSNTHGALQQARVAAHNMFSRKKIAMEYHAIPRVIYGCPEIAATGYTEHYLKASGKPYQTAIAPIGLVGKSIVTDYSDGFVKLLATHNGILLGASIAAPNASEMIGELNLAIHYRMRACQIAKTVHAMPTWSEAIRVAASKIYCV